MHNAFLISFHSLLFSEHVVHLSRYRHTLNREKPTYCSFYITKYRNIHSGIGLLISKVSSASFGNWNFLSHHRAKLHTVGEYLQTSRKLGLFHKKACSYSPVLPKSNIILYSWLDLWSLGLGISPDFRESYSTGDRETNMMSG